MSAEKPIIYHFKERYRDRAREREILLSDFTGWSYFQVSLANSWPLCIYIGSEGPEDPFVNFETQMWVCSVTLNHSSEYFTNSIDVRQQWYMCWEDGSPLTANYGQTVCRGRRVRVLFDSVKSVIEHSARDITLNPPCLSPGSKMILQRQWLYPTHPSIHHCRHTAAKKD